MGTKRKICYIRTWKNIYFSTDPPPSPIQLSHRFSSASKPAAQSFDCCLSHFRTSVSTSSSSAKRLPPRCEPLYATNTSHRKQEHFFMNILCIESFVHKKRTNNAALQQYTQARWPFWVLKPTSEHVHARLLPGLPWSWTKLLPSDIHHSSWSWALLEKLPIVQLLENFPAFYGTRRFITAFT
jgi:hypothetical protein